MEVREVSAMVGPGEAEPGGARADVWKLFNGEENCDSLILELSDSLLFIVL